MDKWTYGIFGSKNVLVSYLKVIDEDGNCGYDSFIQNNLQISKILSECTAFSPNRENQDKREVSCGLHRSSKIGAGEGIPLQ